MKYQITENEEIYFLKKICPGVSSDLKVYLHFHFTKHSDIVFLIVEKNAGNLSLTFSPFNNVTGCSTKERTPNSTINTFTSLLVINLLAIV